MIKKFLVLGIIIIIIFIISPIFGLFALIGSVGIIAFPVIKDRLNRPQVPDELKIPIPPIKYNQKIQVESSSGEGVYGVNLYQMICSCPDYRRNRRSRFYPGDIRRLCKHLSGLYCENMDISSLNEIKQAILVNGYGVKTNFTILHIEELDENVAVTYDHRDEWWNVFARGKKGEIERFGYNTDEKRWSYGESPPKIARELKKVLNKMAKQE